MSYSERSVELRPPRAAGEGTSLPGRGHWAVFLTVLGPGLVVMLADTDVGSIITAARTQRRIRGGLHPREPLAVPDSLLMLHLVVAAADGYKIWKKAVRCQEERREGPSELGIIRILI